MRRLPWFTLIVAVILIFNPLGWEIVGAGIRYSAADWFRNLWLAVTLIGVVFLLVTGCIETWYRGGGATRPQR